MAKKSSVPQPIYTAPPEVEPEDKPSQAENIISVVLGLAVVLVIGAMIINAIKGRNNQPPAPTPEQEQEQRMATVSAMHTVQPGETLWSIAEKYYQDGFKWTEIKKANNLPTDNVEKGVELMIPKLETTGTTISPAPSQEIKPTEAAAPTVMPTVEPSKGADATGTMGATGSVEPNGQALSTSTDKEYTVVAGDTLWAIAQKRYNDPYKWVEIAKANNLANPNLIHPGNKFIMP